MDVTDFAGIGNLRLQSVGSPVTHTAHKERGAWNMVDNIPLICTGQSWLGYDSAEMLYLFCCRQIPYPVSRLLFLVGRALGVLLREIGIQHLC